ncbi:hypothetical protein E3P99_01380 [Wallemia hederae]|uniref:Phosphotyrosine protein phosphatase I domain-containing protein n=1 Tax=Wallemia hederae TaxID=1540922 RepID=A0A4T0FQH2_9BASI|nr:hypothetical protein E3P99_01380 [Wallemia hederae]
MSGEGEIKVLAVCLGNICRSRWCRIRCDLHWLTNDSQAMAEGVLKQIQQENKLPVFVDSAGTAAYHEGEYADDRTISTLAKHGIKMDSLARKVRQSDFNEFDHILAMDGSNLSNLLRMAPKNCKADIRLFGEYGDGKAIQDPYYGGQMGFTRTYEQCKSYGKAFFQSLGYTVN